MKLKDTTAMAILNNKSPITIYFINVEKLAIYNSLNYALLKEAIETITVKSDICNDMMHATIDNRWRHTLLRIGKRGKASMKIIREEETQQRQMMMPQIRR